MPVPNTDWAVYDDLDRPWDKSRGIASWKKYCTKEDGEIDWQKFHKGFFWYDGSDPNKVTSHKMPFVEIIDGKPYAIWHAVRNARARLPQAQIPESDKKRVLAMIRRYYRKAGKDFNEDKTEKLMTPETYQILAIAPEYASIDKPLASTVFKSSNSDYHYIRIKGTLSTETYRELTSIFEGITDGKPVVIDIDSAGGDAAGLMSAIEALERLSKRSHTVAYTNSLMASAAYFLASAANEIVADPSAVVGSLGVITIAMSAKGAFEKMGYQIEVVRSGEHKAFPNAFDALSEEAIATIKEKVDDFANLYLGKVIDLRGNLSEDVLTGKTYVAMSAKEKGLLDDVSTVINIQGKAELETYKAHTRQLLIKLGLSAEEIEEFEKNPEEFLQKGDIEPVKDKVEDDESALLEKYLSMLGVN